MNKPILVKNQSEKDFDEWEDKAVRVAVNNLIQSDYKAKYETLLQGVMDAKAEMELQAKQWVEQDGEQLIASGINEAIEILTQKTGI
jgi:hypothetical protein